MKKEIKLKPDWPASRTTESGRGNDGPPSTQSGLAWLTGGDCKIGCSCLPPVHSENAAAAAYVDFWLSILHLILL